MRVRRLFWAILVTAGVLLLGFIVWIVSLPPPTTADPQPPIAQAETKELLAALRPPKRGRPVVAIIGINQSTETTDYLMPYGILRRADVADVFLIATQAGPVTLYPALSVVPDATTAEFDARYPEGADYVIVPAMEPNDDPAALQWLNAQASKGATVIGVCAGATVVAAAGLLDGKKATTHWYYLEGMLERHPTITYVANRRMVVDGNVATTTGISASMPASLTLIEAIAGRSTAQSVAREIGLQNWNLRHDSNAFSFTQPFATTALFNALAVWNHDEWAIELQPGMDEVSMALVADAWSRTYRSRVLTYAAGGEPVESMNGLRVLPDRNSVDHLRRIELSGFGKQKPADVMVQNLEQIAALYGDDTAQLVAMQLEYPW